jgi:Beta/Gamma crystallin
MTQSSFKAFMCAAVCAAALAPMAAGQGAGGLQMHAGTYGSGATLPVDGPIADLSALRFNDQVSSITVSGGVWELCEHGNFRGRCEIVDASFADLSAIGLNDQVSSVRPAGGRRDRPAPTGGGTTPGAIVFYSDERLGGEAAGLDGSERDFGRLRFNDRARSLEVRSGVWRVCSDANFRGRCEYVDAAVRSLADIGLSGQISSAELTPYDKGPQRTAISLFADGNYYGPFLGFDDGVPNLGRFNFNDTASSILVNRGTWLVCSDIDYRGTCEVVDASTTDLGELAMNDQISSFRRYDNRRDVPRRRDDDDGNGYGGGGRPGGTRGAGGVSGEETTFFPAPTDRGQRIRNADGIATQFCRDQGFSEAVYKGRGTYLSDVLCR